MNICKKSIDPIKQIMIARNCVLTAIAYAKEFYNRESSDKEIILNLENAVEALNLIQRWYMKSSYTPDFASAEQ